MRRWISLVVALALFAPAAASAAEGAMATWLSPQPGQIVSGSRVEVAIGYNTQSSLKVSALEFYVDGQLMTRKVLLQSQTRGVCSFWWDTTKVEQGTHSIVVKVYAGGQMISKIYGTGTVGPNGSSRGLIDVRPPVVTFANIKAGDVLKGNATIKMNAQDDSGQAPMVSLLVDDVLKLLKNTPPYTYDLDTTTYSDGDHSLKTYAYDAAGNRSDPSVVKVAFRNGESKPVVTTMSVSHESAPAVGEATLSQVTPPSVDASAGSRIRSSAARNDARMDMSSTPVAPVVAAAQPKPKVIAMAPKATATVRANSVVSIPAAKLQSSLRSISVTSNPELRAARVAPKMDGRIAAAVKPDIKIAPVAHRSSPVLSAKPVRMASASLPSDVRREMAKPKITAPAAVARPAVVDAPRTSGLHSADATRLPETRQAKMAVPVASRDARAAAPVVKETRVAVASASHKVAEPRPAMPAAKPSGLTRMAMAPTSMSLRATDQKAISSAVMATAPRIEGKPVASTAKPAFGEPDLSSVDTAFGTPAPKIGKSSLKRVQVAMAPDLRNPAQKTHASSAITCPPVIVKPAKARIEKTTVPASGKVKARDYIQKMGGVLFWDPSTHTVTACVGSMVLEMRIGSKNAKINGHEFEMAVAPYLVNDRTVFEAGSFHQACSLFESLSKVGKAELH